MIKSKIPSKTLRNKRVLRKAKEKMERKSADLVNEMKKINKESFDK